jgi:acyl-CoA synthetase (AMP-forming)/AMP-acid ligase II
VLDLHPAAGEGPPVAVVGVPDERKGEAIVLLATMPVDPIHLRKKLLNAGLPALWIPKAVRQVPAVPILASGKLDLRACQELALESLSHVTSVPTLLRLSASRPRSSGSVTASCTASSARAKLPTRTP